MVRTSYEDGGDKIVCKSVRNERNRKKEKGETIEEVERRSEKYTRNEWMKMGAAKKITKYRKTYQDI